MTEAEWQTGTDPTPMLEFVQGKASDRKMRLFLVACARLAWDRLPPGEMREAVEVAEQYADGLASDDERQQRSSRMWAIPVEHGRRFGGNWFTARPREDVAAYMSAMLTVTRPECSSRVTTKLTWIEGRRLTGGQQPGLLREVFGNPFRPVAFNAAWRSPLAVGLASAMYESRAFDRMPVLADALEEAGCDVSDVLDHCRGPGPHVRGCWVVDLILGKQ